VTKNFTESLACGMESPKRTVIRGNHASRDFLHRLYEMRQNGVLVDIQLLPDGGEEPVTAHRLVLAACSPYFNSMFSHWARGVTDPVRVGGVHTQELKLLVDFMYKGELEVTADTAPNILAAADLLLMDKVKTAVCEFLQTLIAPGNCVYLARLADAYTCPELARSAQQFIQRNFEDVCRTDDFLELTDANAVEALICLDNIFVASEETIVETVFAWCDWHHEERAQYLSQLFQHVKLASLSREGLQRLASRSRIQAAGCEGVRHQVQQAIDDNSEEIDGDDGGKESVAVVKAENEAIVNMTTPTLTTSRARGLNKFIVAVGFDSSSVEYLDLDRPEQGWKILTHIPDMRYGLSGAGLASYGDTLLVTGGVGRSGVLKALTRFATFNVRTNVWSDGPAMAYARKCHASVVIDGRLYVMGGSDAQLSVLSVECLDLTQPEDRWAWRPVAELPTWHNGSFAPVIGPRAYLPVMYGSDNDKIYDSSRDLWQGWDAPGDGEEGHRLARDRPGVGQIGDSIYLVGGAGMRELYNTVERWDPRSDRWCQVAPLHHAREGPGVVQHAGRLYVIGGRGGEGTVEMYRPDTNQWEVLGETLTCPDQEYSAVILDRVV